MNYGCFSFVGRRDSNEDAEICEQFMHDKHLYTLIAVFDGHCGDQASKYCKTNFQKVLKLQMTKNQDISLALTQTFSQVDFDFQKKNNQAGTTACICLIDNMTCEFWSANAGDSRAIWFSQKFHQTADHKPEFEQERIMKAGGFVQKIGGIYKVIGQLGVSRAIGDKPFKKYGVISTPDIQIQQKVKFAVICCDGVWDVFESEEVCQMVCRCLKLESKLQIPAQKQFLIQAFVEYVNLNVEEGDQLIYSHVQIPYVPKNLPQVKEEMCQAERMATTLVRMAYLLGSQDNLSAVVYVENPDALVGALGRFSSQQFDIVEPLISDEYLEEQIPSALTVQPRPRFESFQVLEKEGETITGGDLDVQNGQNWENWENEDNAKILQLEAENLDLKKEKALMLQQIKTQNMLICQMQEEISKLRLKVKKE